VEEEPPAVKRGGGGGGGYFVLFLMRLLEITLYNQLAKVLPNFSNVEILHFHFWLPNSVIAKWWK